VRLLVIRIAPALLRLCHASGRTVSTLDFSSVGRTGSRRVPGHFVVRRDYLSRGRNRYTSPTPHVWVPRHVARLIVDYFTSRRIIVDYFDYAARLDASARRAAHRAACRRLLRLRCASGCLGTSRGSSRRSSSTSSPTPCVQVPRHVARLIVDYFDYAARSGARRVARHATRRRLLHLRRASGCLGTSRGSSSTTSPTPCIRVPRLITQLVAPLVANYIDYAARPGASACRVARHMARRAARHRIFAYTVRPGASARRTTRRTARHAARRRLLCVLWLLLAATLALLHPCRAL
jgi:hypothetical protein